MGIPSRRKASTWALPTNPTPITAAVCFIAVAPGISVKLANLLREAECMPQCAAGKVSVFRPRGNGGDCAEMGAAIAARTGHHITCHTGIGAGRRGFGPSSSRQVQDTVMRYGSDASPWKMRHVMNYLREELQN